MSMIKNWKIKDANGNTVTIAAKSLAAAKYQFKRMIAGAEIVSIERVESKVVRLSQPNESEFKPVTPVQADKSMLERNDLCGCGSGRKYKKCCMRKGIRALNRTM